MVGVGGAPFLLNCVVSCGDESGSRMKLFSRFGFADRSAFVRTQPRNTVRISEEPCLCLKTDGSWLILDSMMDVHKKFTEWVIERGVKVNGIRPHGFEGRGLGIMAEQDFEVRGTWFHAVLRSGIERSI
jgi:hypothetical protein